MPSYLWRTLKHLVGALLIVGLFGIFIAPDPVRFAIQSIASVFRPQKTGGEPLDHPFGLLELVPGIKPVVDIVAIHGLDGHRNDSWTADNGSFWLCDLLHEKIPEARIMTYGYDAYTRGKEQFSVQTLHSHAVNFVTALTRKRRETSTEERPIIFVAHSLGGIVLKSALIHSHATHRDHLLEHKAIYLSTYGILFLGTPHQGSDAADWGTVVLNVAKVYQRTNDAVAKNIRRDSEILEQQLSQFLPISANFETKSFYEIYPMPVGPFQKLIVPKSSAVLPGAMNVEPIGLYKDHGSMVKFNSANDEDFKTVSSYLSLMVKAAPEKIAANWNRYKRNEAGFVGL